MRNKKMFRRFFAIVLATGLSLSAWAQEASSAFNLEQNDEHEILIATPDASSGSCGVERWSVKTGTDPDVGLVNLNNPVIQTVSYLRSLTAPATPPANSRVQPTETTMFVIDATLIQYKLENDSDYHLVIKDAQGNTMIGEIPDPACVNASSPFAAYIQSARQQFDSKYNVTTSFQTVSIPVQLTGIGFFDFLHGQTGVAPNGIELHTVLDVQFNPGSGGTPNYALSTAPGSVVTAQGGSTSTTVSVTPSNGFSSNVNFSVAGLPSGVTASFSPASAATTSTLMLTASSTAATGAATLTITGTSGTLSHTTTLNLTVNAAGGGGGGVQTAVYNSTLKAPGCSTIGASCDSGPSLLLGRGTLSGGTEPNQPNTINNSCADGTSGTFHSDESNDRLVIATTDGSPLAAGKTVKITATVWAYDSTSDALDLYSAANANSPTWVFLNTIAPSAAGAQTLSTTFTLPAGGLQAIRANFRYQGTAAACSTGAYDDHDDLIFAVGAGAAVPDFTIGAAPSAATLNQGASSTSIISVTPSGGFTGSVTLAASGLPTGVTATFSPTSTTGISTMTLTASSTAVTGTKTVTITGTSGSLTHTTTLNLTVNAAATPDFALSASPTAASITQGSTTTDMITITPANGFTGSVALSASGLPSGVTAVFSPSNTTGSSTLTLTASVGATTGAATVTITGISGSLTHSKTVNLTVNASSASPIPHYDHVVIVIEENTSQSTVIGNSAAPYINSLAAAGANFTQSFAITHPSQPNYLALFSGSTQGLTDDSCPHTFTSGNLGNQLVAAGFTFAGYSETMPSNGYTGCTSGTSGYARKHNPWVNFSNLATSTNLPYTSFPTDFTTLPTLSFVIPNLCDDMHDCSLSTGDTWLKNNLDAYVTWAKTHNSLLIVTWDEDDSSTTANQVATIFAGASVKPGNYPETINHYRVLRTLEDMYGLAALGSAATATPITDVWGTTVATPDFALSASPTAASVIQGSTTTDTITITSSNGFSGSVALSASGLPSGVTASFSPSSTTGTSTMTLTASSTATTGTKTVTITGTSGALSHTTSIALTVNAVGGGGAQTAVYNTTLKAPSCATVGSSCDSGATLLLGRANLAGGVEPHQPNTINSSCADGTSGTFHSDESNDRIKVATSDGTPLAAGKTVTVTATVWAFDGTSDALDLYYAPNANSPVWTPIQTSIVPTAAGANVLTATYTLPSGSSQAIRANFRYQGSASSCSTGAYDDHDDLIFSVN